jgi:chemotaxis protein MotB
MKNWKLFIWMLPMTWIFSTGCASVYQCGDPIPEKKPGGKRLKAVIEERDDLCTNLNNANAQINELKTDLSNSNEANRSLNERLSNLQGRYDNLMRENISQAELYDAAMQQKIAEINNKELQLKERERALQELQSIINRQDSITQRLNDIVRNALLGFNADELSVEIKNGKVHVSMSDKLLFRSGSTTVEAKGREALQVLAGVLEKNPDIHVLVEGHTDNVPIRTAQFRDNWDLSVVRATSIVRILTDEHQLSPLRFTASGKGEFLPRDTNETREGRARNRRTEIILSPKLDELMQLLESY